MSEESKLILRSAKNARIIENISEMFNVSLQEATDIYYNSETANLIEDVLPTCTVAVTSTSLRKYGLNTRRNYH